MNHRDEQIFEKIMSEINIALDMMQNINSDQFQNDEMRKRAICMTVINIGELIKNVSDETRMANNQIAWRAIAGFRDIAAHKYQTLKMEDVYMTVINDFPVLQTQLKDILNSAKA